ncbi:DUF4176 domain-containing protein [Streptococcus loxodontisalivarius]|uniref:DUF4176 domain-containing protein n=1 Tax=Streptococcus loxodontisalivarius TaxID=1349415 RepID=A0ABS2PUZ3_9STRE|nr:DUF4176 domain-containing protein [Streptococcus loxodontisalivarius]MBM7643751.1 hypothetical protein [Streptococcus loxodontisalivarius]
MSEILPLGSVVTLANNNQNKFMIISRGILTEKGDGVVYFDYSGVVIPQGMVNPNELYFFNKDNIDQILFEGYNDSEEQEFEKIYDKLILESGYPKGTI